MFRWSQGTHYPLFHSYEGTQSISVLLRNQVDQDHDAFEAAPKSKATCNGILEGKELLFLVLAIVEKLTLNITIRFDSLSQ